jgi:cell division protein FtsI (penicillin-binding protein 3)
MNTKRIAIAIFGTLLAVFAVLAGRCFCLQYSHSRHYQLLALRQLEARVRQLPRRGTIFDRRGRVLAASGEIKNVFVEPRGVTDLQATASFLGGILDMPAQEICRTIADSKNTGYVRIGTDITPQQYGKLSRANVPAVGIESSYRRYYPMRQLAAHLAGFTSIDNYGLGGIELQYDKPLNGSAGAKVYLADAFRRPIRLKTNESTYADGQSLVLTLDATIQQIARQELLAQYKSYNAESATAILMEPATGAVLAIVSLPDFDPEAFAVCDPNVLRNRALTDPFEPGSIIKPIVMAIALDAGVVRRDETVFCEYGNYRGKGFGRIGEYNNRQFGHLTIRDVLVKSSNIGMAKIGQRLGAQRLYDGLRLFGFGRQSGIDLPGEDEGLLWRTDRWTGYSITRIPFGQELAVTAIQVARAYCILANGGRLVRPYIVQAVMDQNGNVVQQRHPPVPAGYVVKPEVAQWIVREPLTGVVNEGTGKRAGTKKWQVCGKTGTANIANPDGKGYSEDDYVASFVGVAPAEDPVLLVFVAIRKPDRSLGKGYTGGAVAAPVAGAILQRTLTYLEQSGRGRQLAAIGAGS